MTDNNPVPQPGDPGPDGEIVMPSDFPRDPFPAALWGSQPKFSARFIDGQYVVGLTQEERKQRYLACTDLVDQLTAYVKRKHAQRPDVTLSAILDNVTSRIPYQGWDLGRSEIDWMVKHLRARFPQGLNG